MTIPTLATIEQFWDHLRLPYGTETADLQLKLDVATALVCEYIADRHPMDAEWIAEIESWDIGGSPAVDPPKVVVLAALTQASELYMFRGDTAGGADRPPQERGFLSPSIENLLSRYKNRAFA